MLKWLRNLLLLESPPKAPAALEARVYPPGRQYAAGCVALPVCPVCGR